MESPEFEPNPAAYTYAQLADQVEAQIRSGKLRPGSRLMGEREMAEVYGVAVGTVRRAVRELRERGLVYTLPGKGTFVADGELPESK